ncbi:hypothetical protein NDU88_005742 [Pleurodeles waltl]|uniref:Uncharacterized protein n=1 Tax=Pleurodeles waltl TaxID=8319 RepID=A0AAV7W8P3_PLEWA|nr:hypothetical protein NDU88_005742 [Pleurodeles waltl]
MGPSGLFFVEDHLIRFLLLEVVPYLSFFCHVNGLCNSDNLSRAELLKLLGRAEVVVIPGDDDGDDNDEEGALSEDEEKMDPVLGPELQGDPNSTQADTQDGEGTRGLSPKELEDRKTER